MFLLTSPSDSRIRDMLASQNGAPFSYPEVGATRSLLPAGYAIDRLNVQVGRGAAAFDRAKSAIRSWKMFDMPWVHLYWPDVPIVPRSTVAVVVWIGVWALNSARIVYVVDEARRYGFAYGTLPEHVECGEERFTVEWRDDDTVWYDLLAFSRPNHALAKMAGRLCRRLQARFRRDSAAAMQRWVGMTGL